MGAGRDEITTGFESPQALAFSGGRAYAGYYLLGKIISYPRFSSVAFAVAPDAPRVFAQSDSEIEIAWNAVLGATHYKLYRSETSGGLFAQVEGDISITRYRDGNLPADTSYYYQAEACSGDECSGRSPEVSATTAPPVSSTPAAATQNDGAISITWSAVAGATHYKLYRATASGGTYMQIGGDIAATGYLDSGLSETSAYYYQLEVCNDNGCSGRSPEVSAATYATGSLGARRDEITSGLNSPRGIAFSGGRAYVVNRDSAKIVSYPVEAGGELGVERDEITTGLNRPEALAFSGGRAYVGDGRKITSYPVGANGKLGVGRNEITNLYEPVAIAFFGGRAYVGDGTLNKIISYPVDAGGILGAGRDEITAGLGNPLALAFSGGRAYVANLHLDKIISYPVDADGELGAGRDETTGASFALAFSGGRAYVVDSSLNKIISYPVGADGSLGAGRDEITTGLSSPIAIAFAGGWVYVGDGTLNKIISYPLFSSVAFAVAPDAPRVVTQSDSAVSITWNAVLGATHYKLYRSETSGGTYTQVGVDISITRYQDDFSANIYYYYQLEACSGDECSERSPAVGIVPDAPTVTAQNDTEISIKWSAIAGATHYKLYRATVSGGAYTQIGENIDALDYLDGDLSESTAYYYQLEACKSGGCSDRSPEVSATTYATGSLGAGRDEITSGLNSPRGIAFSGGRAYVVNRDSDKIVSYPVGAGGILGAERDEVTSGLGNPYAIAFSGGRAYVTDGNHHKITSYPVGANGKLGVGRNEITNLNEPVAIAFFGGRAYVADVGLDKIISYAVKAGGILGAGRDEITAGLGNPRALAFSGGRAYVADLNSGKIIFYPVDADGRLGEEGREVITTGLDFLLALAFSGGRAYMGDGNLDKVISYPVGADGSLGEGRDEITAGLDFPGALAFSGGRLYVADGTLNKIISYPVFSSVAFAVAPDAPRVVTQSDSAVSITWNAVLGATHYNLYRSETSGGTFAQVGGDISITRYRDDNLSEDTPYYYQLEACNGDECSGSSPEVSVTTAPMQSTPTAATQNNGAISIVWSAVAGATHYNLYRSKTNDGSFTQIGGEITATDYVDSNLDANTSYYYRLEVCNDNGCSGRSPVGSAITAPAIPMPTATAQNDTEISIVWSEVAGATHYNLYRATVSGGTYMQIGGDIATTGYLDSNLPEATPYYYQLEACNSGGCSGRSPEVSTTTYATGSLGAGRDEITTGLYAPRALAFSGGRAYVVDADSSSNSTGDDNKNKIISYPVEAGGELGAGRVEIGFFDYRTGYPVALAFSGGRAYVVDIANGNKIISYPVGAGGELGAGRDEITVGLSNQVAFAFSGGRVYVVGYDSEYNKIISSYPVGSGGRLGAPRDEITAGLDEPRALAFSGGRAYVTDVGLDKIISYPVEADGILGTGRDEITIDLDSPIALAFSGGRAYVVDYDYSSKEDKIISYPVGAGGELGAGRDEITTTDYNGPRALAFSGGRAYVADEAYPGKIISYPVFSSVAFAVAPDALRVFAQSESESEIEITWNAVLGATHYKLYRSATSGGLFEQVGGDISITRYRDGGLSANIYYYYQLEACSGDECSERLPARTAPAIPMAAQSDIAVSITWSDVAGATHYKLYRSETSGGPYTQIGGDIAATDYLDSGISLETAYYYYQLEACNGNGCSGRSPEVSFAPRSLGAGREEITSVGASPTAFALSSSRAYVVDGRKIISYPVEADGRLGARREEAVANGGSAPVFSGGRAYVGSGGRIISYPVGADGVLGEGRDEITTGLFNSNALAFSGDRAYVAYSDFSGNEDKIISYPVGADGILGAGRDEITIGLSYPTALAFSGGRAYVVDYDYSGNEDKIISYAVGAGGELGAGRDEITVGLGYSSAISFSGGRAYVVDYEDNEGKIISYPVGTDGILGARRDEITTTREYYIYLEAIAFLGDRAYVMIGGGNPGKIISYPVFSSVAFAVVPDTPRVFAQSDSEIEIAWNAVLGATHYKLYRSETSGGTYTQIGGDITITRYLNDGLAGNTSYYYQLEACSGDECSEHSPEVSVRTRSLGAGRDEITAGLSSPQAIAFSGGRAYVVNSKYVQASRSFIGEIISYPVGAGGILGVERDEITTGLYEPIALAFSGGRAYVMDTRFDKIISYPVGADGRLGAGRDEITAGLGTLRALVFSGGRVYVVGYYSGHKIISYAVGTDGILGAGRDEITTGLDNPRGLAFSGGRAYVVDGDFSSNEDKIISYPVGAGGELGAGRDEITTGFTYPGPIAFSGGRAYVADSNLDKVISYPVGADGRLGAGRDEITTGLGSLRALAFSGGRAYVADRRYVQASGSFLHKIISYPLFSSVAFAVAPDAPRVVAQSESEIEIAWNAASGATHYKLYRSETSGGVFSQVGGDISITRYRNDGISANIYYYYQLEACSDDECSERSPAAKTATAAPMAAAQSNSKIAITWSAVAGAAYYKLYRATVSDGAYAQIGGDIAATDYLDSGLSAETAYYYRLEACNSGGCSGRSFEVSIATYGSLGARRDEMATVLHSLNGIAFSGGRAYVVDGDFYDNEDKIISYPVGAGGELGAGRDEITTGLGYPQAIAFSGGRAYVTDTDLDKIISYPVGADGRLGLPRDEITSGLDVLTALAFSGGRAYVVEYDRSRDKGKITSYSVGAGGRLGAERDEITTGVRWPIALAFSGGRAYVADRGNDKIISYPVGAGGELGAARDEMTGLVYPRALAFLGDRAYVVHHTRRDEIISYPVGASGELGTARDEIVLHTNITDLVFSGGRVYMLDGRRIISYSLFSSVSFAVAPDAPRVVTQSDSAVSITWNAVLGATHYKLYRSETSGGLFAQVGVDISITRYRDDNLSADTSYYYQLEACSGDECSGRSPVGSATTAPMQSTPTATTQNNGAISITWSAVAGATHYKLYRSETNDGSFMQIGGKITATDYVDSNLDANTSYYYRLEVCNDNDCSDRSPVGSATTTPGIPMPTATAQSDSEISITWSAVAGATHYKLYRGVFLQIGGEIMATGYLDSGLSEINSYYYQLEACNSDGCSGLSPQVAAFTYATGSLGAGRDEITAGLREPSALAFSGGRAYVAGYDSGYKIISYPVGAGGELSVGRDEITTGLRSPRALAFSGGRAYVAGGGKIISYPVGADGELGAGRDEITVGLLQPQVLAFSDGRAYVGDYDRDESEYKIISYPVGADGRLGAGRDETPISSGAPNAFAFSGGRVYMADGNIGIISYPVEADGELGAARNEITTGFRNPSALAFSGGRVYGAAYNKIVSYPVGVDGRLSAPRDEITTGLNGLYAFAFSGGRIYVADYKYLFDSRSYLSKIISYPLFSSVAFAVAPDAPRVVAQSNAGEIEIAWNAVLGATHYKLYRSATSDGLFTQIEGEISITRYRDSGLSANIYYYYQLEACSGDECLERSPVARAAPAAMATPQNDTEISITWSAVAGATHYKLYRATVSGGAYAQIGGDIEATGYLDSGLSVTTSYYYQLEACNSGGCSGRSPEVSAVTYGSLGARNEILGVRNEIETDSSTPAFLGGRAYVVDGSSGKIISYPVGADGELGAGRDEVTTDFGPRALAFSGRRAYMLGYDSEDSEYKIVSYRVGVDGILSAPVRHEIITGLNNPRAIAFSGERIYVADYNYSFDSRTYLSKIVSYPVDVFGGLGVARNEITAGLRSPSALVFSGGRIYMADSNLGKVISYPVGAGGRLGAGRDETTGLNRPNALAFSGGRAYVVDSERGKIISYPVGAGGEFGAGRDEIRDRLLNPSALVFSSGRAYVLDRNNKFEYKIVSYPLLLPPVAPDAPRVVTQSNSKILITWSEISGAAHYKLYRSETSGGLFAQVGGDISIARYQDSGLSAETYYYYQLEACNRGGCSEHSPEDSAETRSLGSPRDEITADLGLSSALAFSGGRAYVVFTQNSGVVDKIISYPVGAGGELGVGRDEITTGLYFPYALAFSGGRAYVVDVSSNKIISYPVGANGELGVGRDEITTGLTTPSALAFSGGRAYVVDFSLGKIISYPVGAGGELGAGRDEKTDLSFPIAFAFSGGRAYAMFRANSAGVDKIISYPVGADGELGMGRDEITTGLRIPLALAFSGDRAYVVESGSGRILSYPVGAGGELGAERDEITNFGSLLALAFLGGRAYVVDTHFDKIISYPQSSSVSFAVVPDAPRVAAQSDREIEIAWNAVLGATHYKLYRSETSGGLFMQVEGDISVTRYLDGGFSADTSYYYQLEACSGDECSGSSPEVSVTTAPMPSTPTAATQNNGAISIVWSAVAGATHYKLYRSETNDGSFTQIGGKITATDYVDSNLDANTSYYYRLEVCNDNGCSGRSPIGSAITTPATPSTPTAAAQSDTEISIVWSEVAGATHYNLYRATVSGGTYTQIGGDIATTGYLDSGLSEATAYYYQLEACNGGECSGRSPEVSVSTYGSLGAGRDEITTGLNKPYAISFSGSRAYVVNRDSAKIVSYPVEAGGELGAERNEITSGLNNPYAIAFSGGRAYVTDFNLHKIISYPVGANGELGVGRDEITNLNEPVAIAFFGGRAYVVDVSATKIISYAVKAGGILGAGRDEITAGLHSPRALAFSGGRAYVADLNLDKIISYPVDADGRLGTGRNEITSGLSLPLALAFSGGRAYVGDGNLDKVISYPVGSDGSLGAGRDEITAGLDFPVALAFAGGWVYVGDGIINKIISYPLFSSVAFAVAPDAPSVAAQSESEIEIIWNAVLGATHYKLYRSETSGGLFAQVGVDISITRYRDGNLSADTPYYYQLEACSGDECSGSSPEVSVTTAPMQSTPTAATQNNGAISIVWSAVAGATHYKLYRSETNDGSFTQIGGKITATDYVDSNLDANTSYYYRLEVCNDNGCSGRSPVGSAITAPATPTTPTAATQSDSEISIVWSAVAGATHYNLYRATVSGGAYMQIGGDIAATDYLDSNLSETTAYYYRLESCNSGGCSGRSPQVSAATYATGSLGAGRDEITGLSYPTAIAFSGGRVYVVDADLSGNEDKIISYPVGADGELGAARDEITTGLDEPSAIAFSGGRAYVVDDGINKIISYPVGTDGRLGAGRDEITTGLDEPSAIAFSGGRAYVGNGYYYSDKIISYPVGADGVLGARRDEITIDLRPRVERTHFAFLSGRLYVAVQVAVTATSSVEIISYPVEADGRLGARRDEITPGLGHPIAIAFSGGRAYMVDFDAFGNADKIISYPVEAGGILGAGRDEITLSLDGPRAIAFSGGRAYVADSKYVSASRSYRGKIISYPVFSSVSFAVAPNAPHAAAQSESEIEIAWNAVLGATHYNLYRSETSGGLFEQVGGDISITRYQDDFSANIYYYYQLEACSGDECSERSPAVRIASGAPTVATQSGTEISITWSAIVGATHYKLYRATVSGGAYTQIGGNIDALGYLDGGLSEATPYYYRLEVCNSGGCSDRSHEVSATTYGSLGAGRDEITTGLSNPRALAFSGGRAYVVNFDSSSEKSKIISYPVEAGGELGAGRDEITTDSYIPRVLAFSGGRAYVGDAYYSGNEDKIISYPVEADGILGAGRDEIMARLGGPVAIAFSGGRAYVADIDVYNREYKIISYPMEAGGILGAGREEMMPGLDRPRALAFSGGRAYVVVAYDNEDKIIHKITSYPVGADGRLGAGRDEITVGLSFPRAFSFAGGRAYVVDLNLDKIISYPVGADGILGAGRDEITPGLDDPIALAFAGGRAYVMDDRLDKIISYPLLLPPVAPDAPSVVAQSNSKILITWSELSGATHYKLYRSETSGGTYTQVGGDITITRYQDDNLSADTPYYYQLEACNGDECSEHSPEVSAETRSLGAGRDEVTAGLFVPEVLAFSGGRAYVVDTNLDKIISYPVGSGGELGAGREEITIGLSNPTDIAFSGGWAYVVDYDLGKIISYPVEADGILGAGRDEITTGLNNPSALAFSGGRVYVANIHFIRDFASYRSKIISYPVEASGELGAGRDEITILLFSPSDIAFSGGRAYVVDSNLGNIISYPVEADGILGAGRYETNGFVPRALAFSGGRAYVADSSNDKIISYPVGADGVLDAERDEITTGLYNPLALAFLGGRAYVADSSKIISYPIFSSVSFAVVPDALRVVAKNEIEIVWNAVLGATHYKLYRSETSGGTYTQIGGDISITRYRDDNLPADTPYYYYQLEACNGDECSGRSPTARTVPAATAIPQSDSEISITWDAVAGATHYKLYRSETSGGLFTPIGGDITTTNYLDGGLSVRTTYYYRLEACNSGECSGRSLEVAVSTYGALGARRDEITTGLNFPFALAFSGGRAYMVDLDAFGNADKIISYPVKADGRLGAERDEVTAGLGNPIALAFSGGRAYVVNGGLAKIISYPVGTDGILGAGRDEITTGLINLVAFAFSGGRAYVADTSLDKIISYPVGAGGELGAGRDEITIGLTGQAALAFSGGRAYVVNGGLAKIISYPVGADGILGAGRDEITTGLNALSAIAFSGGRAYVGNSRKIISYPVGAGGELGAPRDEITTGLFSLQALAFSGGRAYVVDLDRFGNEDKIISYPVFSSVPFAVATDAPRVFAQSESEIEIAWNAVLGATHYKLYRSETSGGLFAQVGGDISITRYQDDNLSANTSYYYQLEACSGDECSGRSPEVSATTDASGASGSRGAASAADAADAVAKRQQDSDPIESSSEACNGDECSQRSPEVLTATRSAGEGVFHASGWVVGLDYQYGNGETGKTGEKGAFPLRSGKTVVFSTGQVTLGAVSIAADANADFFTPTRLGDQARAIRIERLLIALDSDGENDNGVVSLNAESASDALTAWNAARASDDEATTPINGRMRAIPSAATAATLLKRANNCAFSGAFAGRWTDADGNGGEHAMVLLAFNEGDIDGVSNPRGVFAGIDQITGGNGRNGKALWIKLWNQGGGLQSAVTKYGAASGALSIDLSAFPVVATMTASNGVVMTITVESYGKIGYAVGGESGVLSRVRQEIPNADYRLAGFYSNDDRATPPGEQKPEIGIFAASIDGKSEKFEPYIGRFLTNGAGVYSNIGHPKQDAAYTRQGTPADGTITIVADDGREIELRFIEQRDGVGYGAYEDTDANGDDGFDIFGGWCKL